jgi:histone H3/H4
MMEKELGMNLNDSNKKETLIVVSKLKKYIKEESGLNTSSNLMDALSERIRGICKTAIENAKSDGRKTVMDRDLPDQTSTF